MARVTPQEAAEKWARRISQSTEDVRRGIERVTEAPGAKAAQNQQGYVRGVQDASERWARKTGAVSLSEWKDAALNKGVGRIADGARQAQGKMSRVMQELLPAVDEAANAARAIPKDGTIESSIARASEFMRRMRTFKDRR